MANRTINGRIVNKHDTEANWSKSSFVPLKGEIVVFDIDNTYSYERFKIGDGITSVNNLPFVGADKVDKVSGKQLSTNDYTTAEKNKLAGIAEGANKTVVDSALSSSSTNPVQNKVVSAAISNLNTLVGDTSVSEQITTAVSTKADASHMHDNRYYTETEIDSKLSGKSDTSHTHSSYVNQNAFSNIKVGNTTVAADTATDTVTLVAGNNVTLTPDATNDQITIAATDTVYTHPSSGVTAGTYKSVTVNAQGHVTAGSNPTTLSGYGITDAAAKSHSHNNATTSAAGFMSATDKSTLDNLSGLVGDTSVSAQIAEAIADKVDKVSGKQLSTNDYTTTEKNKLANIASGAEVNQNAFSNIAVGTTTIAADTKTDTLTIAAGNNVTITPDATNDKITIAATDTVYTHPTYTSKSSGLYKVTVDGTGHVSGATAVAKSDITALGIPAQDTTYSAATTSTAGLMSASDKSKLDGIATGANKTTVDSSLSSTSTNPVQNKVVNAAISNLNTLVGDTAVSEQIADAVDDCITGLSVSGKVVTYTKGDGSTGTITTQDTNTTYSAATTSAAGLMSASDKSKLDGITASADAVSFSRSLTSGTKVGTITINGTGTDLYAPTNTDTHYTSKNVVGSSTATSNTTSALTNGNVYLNSVENGVVTSAHKISGSGATTVTTDTSGNIVVSSNNTTYSAATTSAAGLMSASDKTTLSNLSALVGDTAVSTQISNATSGSMSGNAATATKVNNSLAIKLNSGTTEGTNLFTFNGSAAKTINITPSAIGAAASSHGTHVSYGTSAAALGTSSAGSASTVSRSDHVHALPALTSCTGTLSVAKGGTGSTTASEALTNLGAVAKSGDTMTGSLRVGTSSTTSEMDVHAIAASGSIYLYAGGSSSSNRGIYTYSSSGTEAAVITINPSNVMTFHGTAASANSVAWTNVSGRPSALANPNALTISLNGTSQGAYDGSSAKSINITPSSIGAAASSHTHSYLPLSGGTLSGSLLIGNSGSSATTVTDAGLEIRDLRNCTIIPSTFNRVMTPYFCIYKGGWKSVLHMKGWTDSTYAAWELAGNADTNNNSGLYTRSGLGSSWGAWEKILTSENYSSYADKGITTAGTGAAYTATVSGITALTAGVSFIMIPHTVSTSTAPTLNVNSLGAKTIKRRLSNLGTGVQAGYTAGWLASGIPFRVTYDGTQWVVSGMEQPAAADLYGTLAIGKGGTGLTSSPSMLVNLGSTSASDVLQASPRPGVTGTLPVSNGGTGSTTAAGARTNLGMSHSTSSDSLQQVFKCGDFQIVIGFVTGVSVSASSYKDVVVSYTSAFAERPCVVVGLQSSSDAGSFGRVNAALKYTGSTTELTIRVANGDTSGRAPNLTFIAMGKI